jgi:hypothetical protein
MMGKALGPHHRHGSRNSFAGAIRRSSGPTRTMIQHRDGALLLSGLSGDDHHRTFSGD